MRRLAADLPAALEQAREINALLDEWAGRREPVKAPRLRPVRSPGIYVILSTQNRCKIGFSEGPINRLKALQASGPGRLTLMFYCRTPNARRIEIAAHDVLDDKRVNGEWFNVTPDLAIATVLAAMRALDA